MNLLAIDTATEACSAALLLEDQLTERYRVAPRQHANLILPFIDELITEAHISLRDLDAIAVTRGPGSFTGVRIGISVAQGLATGAELGLVGVSTLHAMARAVHEDYGSSRVLAVLDARMNEVYCGGYMFDGGDQEVFKERVCSPGSVRMEGEGWIGCGPGLERYPELAVALGNRLVSTVTTAGQYPRAGIVARIAGRRLAGGFAAEPIERVEPVYLRNQVARKPGSS